MSEKYRPCAKCGVRAGDGVNISLHRFPSVGKNNIARVRAWATFCYPSEDWTSAESLDKLSKQHKLLCSKHFSDVYFIHGDHKRLSRYAIPIEAQDFLSAGPSTREDLIDLDNTQTSSKQADLHSRKRNMESFGYEYGNTSASQTENAPIAHTLSEPTSQIDLKSSSTGVVKPLKFDHGKKSNDENANITDTQTSSKQADLHSSSRSNMESFGYEHGNTSASQTENAPIAHVLSKPRGIMKEMDVCKVLELSPRKQKLYKKCRRNLSEIARLRNKFKNTRKKFKQSAILQELASNATVNSVLEKKITGPFALLLQSQFINTRRKLNGRRWRIDDKILALGIYKKSSACYRLLRRLFCLPSPNTLKGLLNKVPLKCGLNPKIFDTIKGITEKRSTDENLCIVTFDEMSIRKNLTYNSRLDQIEGYQDHGNQGRSKDLATHALLFMAIGLRKKWKQPLAFYFSGDCVTADRLKVLIKEVLSESLRVGLIVVGTVCDLDGGNLKAINLLGSTRDRPCFELHGHELVTILDPPHLLKCFRNMFLKYDIECKEEIQVDGKPVKGVAKWSHIKEFYKQDNSNPNFVFAPGLTQQHLDPNGKQKMKVRLAAQVLSHSVASGLYAKISANELPREATATAMVVNKIDQLFDSLNADTPDLKKGKKYLTNMTDKSPHKTYFAEMKKFFNELKFVGARSKPPSQEGWIRTLNAVELLHKNLKKMNIQSLSTRRLNQDPLENCFGCIRNNCGCNPNPNTVQFVAALKTSILGNLLHTGSKRNCEDDTNIILDDFKSFVCNENDQPISDHENMADLDCSFSSAFDDMNVEEPSSEVQACTYVCGFIYKKLASNCDFCKSAMIAQNANPAHIFVQFKEYNENRESLFYVTKDFVKTVEHGATVTNNFLKSQGNSYELKKKLFSNLSSTLKFDWLETCPAHFDKNVRHIMNSIIYICIKRYCIIENRKFIEEASRKALKRKIDIIKHQ